MLNKCANVQRAGKTAICFDAIHVLGVCNQILVDCARGTWISSSHVLNPGVSFLHTKSVSKADMANVINQSSVKWRN